MWHRLDIQDLENSSISETTCVHQPQKHQLTVARWTPWATLLISIVVVFGFWWHCHLSQVIHHLKLSFEITLSVASKFVGSMQLRTLVFYDMVFWFLHAFQWFVQNLRTAAQKYLVLLVCFGCCLHPLPQGVCASRRTLWKRLGRCRVVLLLLLCTQSAVAVAARLVRGRSGIGLHSSPCTAIGCNGALDFLGERG